MRRVCYVSGTRADFGLMANTLQLAQRCAALDISVCVTGMHLSPRYGNTVNEIEAQGLRICGRIAVELDDNSGAAMAKALGQALIGITEVFVREQPHLVLVLGDRGEMLAGALAAVHLNIPVVHIHGGERSGTVDEPIRHAISKLSHYHLVATEGACLRLIRMGEDAEKIFITGAPGLDGLTDMVRRTRADLCKTVGFDAARPVALIVFHPVLRQADRAGEQMRAILNGVLGAGLQALCLKPNSDAGAAHIRQALQEFEDHRDVRIYTHLTRTDYVSWMAAANVMVGNSSSGIIEAATLGVPVVNVGERQQGRERSGNVVDVPADDIAVARGVQTALGLHGQRWTNVYGSGDAGRCIVDLLSGLPISADLLMKSNAY